MLDLQSLWDGRNVPLEKVGVTGVRLPIKIRERTGGFQHVTAEVGLFVEVPATVRGTHLSRFMELLSEWTNEPVAAGDIEVLLTATRERLGSFSAEASVSFPYFLERAAPVTGAVGVLDYICGFWGRLESDGYDFHLGVEVPVTTLCPCSKAISQRGAHNQRANVKVAVKYERESFVWLEDLIETVEAQASCALFPVLKRADERFVTEAAFDNPKFVEDVVRDVALALKGSHGIAWYSVSCESQESIHTHNAFAATSQLLIPGAATEDGALAESALFSDG